MLIIYCVMLQLSESTYNIIILSWDLVKHEIGKTYLETNDIILTINQSSQMKMTELSWYMTSFFLI